MTSHPLRLAVEARDVDALVDTLAPDVVFWSPLISPTFKGREDVAELFRLLADELLFTDDFRYTLEMADGDIVVLGFASKVKGKDVSGIDVLRVDDQNKIVEMTVYLRPLTGTTAVAQTLAPKLAARQSKRQEAMAGFGTRMLARMASTFDRLAKRQIGASAKS